MRTATLLPSPEGWNGAPWSTRWDRALKTRIDPNWISTSSPKVSSTVPGDWSSTEPDGGLVETSWAWALAGSAQPATARKARTATRTARRANRGALGEGER